MTLGTILLLGYSLYFSTGLVLQGVYACTQEGKDEHREALKLLNKEGNVDIVMDGKVDVALQLLSMIIASAITGPFGVGKRLLRLWKSKKVTS